MSQPRPPEATPDAGPAPGGPPPPAPPLGGDGLTQLLVSRAIGLGYYHSCLITPDQTLRCAGDMANPQDPRLHPPGGFHTDQIFGSHNGFCALRVEKADPDPVAGSLLPLSVTARRLTCWGHKNPQFPPANLEMDPIHFGIGYEHGCAVNRDHSVVCWGQGRGPETRAPPGLKAKSLAVASFFNCAVLMDDSVQCWGTKAPPPPEGLRAKLVAAVYHGNLRADMDDLTKGTSHACAIRLGDDTVTCWGDDIEGNLAVPPDLGPARDVAVGTWDSCALRASGEPVCWGNKHYSDPPRFHPLPAGLHLRGLRAKLDAYCGIKMEDDTVACWGDEQHEHITFPAGGVKLYNAP
jgi:hypothetical protein